MNQATTINNCHSNALEHWPCQGCGYELRGAVNASVDGRVTCSECGNQTTVLALYRAVTDPGIHFSAAQIVMSILPGIIWVSLGAVLKMPSYGVGISTVAAVFVLSFAYLVGFGHVLARKEPRMIDRIGGLFLYVVMLLIANAFVMVALFGLIAYLVR